MIRTLVEGGFMEKGGLATRSTARRGEKPQKKKRNREYTQSKIREREEARSERKEARNVVPRLAAARKRPRLISGDEVRRRDRSSSSRRRGSSGGGREDAQARRRHRRRSRSADHDDARQEGLPTRSCAADDRHRSSGSGRLAAEDSRPEDARREELTTHSGNASRRATGHRRQRCPASPHRHTPDRRRAPSRQRRR